MTPPASAAPPARPPTTPPAIAPAELEEPESLEPGAVDSGEDVVVADTLGPRVGTWTFCPNVEFFGADRDERLLKSWSFTVVIVCVIKLLYPS